MIFDLNAIKDTDVRCNLAKSHKYYNQPEFTAIAGQEHYRLLTYISHQYDNVTFLDIGTNHGFSAVALASNPYNQVISYDIEDKVDPELKINHKNIAFKIENILTDKKYLTEFLTAAVIFLDIDPHDGYLEYQLYELLRDNNYPGLLICDDIWYFKTMRNNFWYKIPSLHKIDLTEIGHWSGTGLIRFKYDRNKYYHKYNSETSVYDIDSSGHSILSNHYTFVTAYFDLTKCSDASKSIKERPANHYLESASSTMSIEANLIVFAEAEHLELLKAMRPAFLADKTQYIVCNLEELPLTKYREKIIENRKSKPYAFDDRNTASYYLLCMARYALLKRIIKDNPFESSHFAWINICIERMGFKNVMNLNNVISTARDKFSTCYIDFIPPSLIDDPAGYFQRGRCSMCSGFFTGNATCMQAVCNWIEEKFLYYLELGYGHADEQLYSPVYFDHPEYFEFYYGDYCSMVTNYDKIRDSSHAILNCFLRNCIDFKYYYLAYPACKALEEYYTETQDTTNKELFLSFCIITGHKFGKKSLAMRALVERECIKYGH